MSAPRITLAKSDRKGWRVAVGPAVIFTGGRVWRTKGYRPLTPEDWQSIKWQTENMPASLNGGVGTGVFAK